jgi:hypothetical protein
MFRRSHIRSGPGRAVWSAICNMSASCGAKLMLILRDDLWLMNPMSTSLLRILSAQVRYSMSKPSVPRFLITIRGTNRSRSACDPWHHVLSLNVAAKTASQHVIVTTLFPCRVHDGLRANRHQVPSTAFRFACFTSWVQELGQCDVGNYRMSVIAIYQRPNIGSLSHKPRVRVSKR